MPGGHTGMSARRRAVRALSGILGTANRSRRCRTEIGRGEPLSGNSAGGFGLRPTDPTRGGTRATGTGGSGGSGGSTGLIGERTRIAGIPGAAFGRGHIARNRRGKRCTWTRAGGSGRCRIAVICGWNPPTWQRAGRTSRCIGSVRSGQRRRGRILDGRRHKARRSRSGAGRRGGPPRIRPHGPQCGRQQRIRQHGRRDRGRRRHGDRRERRMGNSLLDRGVFGPQRGWREGREIRGGRRGQFHDELVEIRCAGPGTAPQRGRAARQQIDDHAVVAGPGLLRLRPRHPHRGEREQRFRGVRGDDDIHSVGERVVPDVDALQRFPVQVDVPALHGQPEAQPGDFGGRHHRQRVQPHRGRAERQCFGVHGIDGGAAPVDRIGAGVPLGEGDRVARALRAGIIHRCSPPFPRFDPSRRLALAAVARYTVLASTR